MPVPRLVFLIRSSVVALIASLPAVASAQGSRVSAPPALVFTGRVGQYGVSSSGRTVFTALPKGGASSALFSAALSGAEPPVQLSAPLSASESLDGFQLTPDGARVVYLVAHDTFVGPLGELWVAPVDGSVPAFSLDPSWSCLVGASEYAISPDSSRVVFRAYASSIEVLAVVPLDGSALPAPLDPGLNTSPGFVLTPDSSRAVFINGSPSLRSAPLDRSAAPVLLVALVPGGEIQSPQLMTSDGVTLVYTADQAVDGVFELYRVAVDGSSAAVKLSGNQTSGGDVDPLSVRISADGARVAYVADALVDGVNELFSVPLFAGSPPQRLNASLASGGDVTSFVLSSDSARAAYVADQLTDGVDELFAVPLDGSSAPIRLNGALVAGGDVAADVQLSADGARVVYRADQLQDDVVELFSVPLDGSAPAVRLDPGMVAGGDVAVARISPDSTRVAYLADQEIDSRALVHSAPIDGSAAATLLDPLACIASVPFEPLLYEPGGHHLVHRALHGVHGLPLDSIALYGVPDDGSAPPLLLSRHPALLGFTSVHEFLLDADGRSVVYDGAVEGAECTDVSLRSTVLEEPYGSFPSRTLSGAELPLDARSITPGGRLLYTAWLARGIYSTPLDASSPPFLMLPELDVYSSSIDIQIAADGVTSVVWGRSTTTGRYGLFAAATEAPGTVVPLSAPAHGDLRGFRLDPRRPRVAYVADQLYLAQLDGSGERTLNGPLANGGQVVPLSVVQPGFDLTSDGRRALYLADERADEVVELFSVDLRSLPEAKRRGTGPLRVRLNPALVPGGDVREFKIAPDDARIVYCADQDVDQSFELYSVPADGSAPSVRLGTGQLDPFGAHDFKISAAGERVVYRTATGILWSVPIGGGVNVRLDTHIVTPYTYFQLDPTGRRVVFLSSQPKLYSVPIDGSAAAILLGTRPSSFKIAAQGGRVVFSARAATGAPLELFVAPLDGSWPMRRVSRDLVAGGAVSNLTSDYEITPDGLRVLYLADAFVPGRVELFMSPLGHPLLPTR